MITKKLPASPLIQELYMKLNYFPKYLSNFFLCPSAFHKNETDFFRVSSEKSDSIR